MSNSKLATYTKISPNRTSPRTHEIDTVSIHCTGGQGTAKQILNLGSFTKYSSNYGASCNYAIGYDGSIGLCVEEKDRSWCTSSRSNDHRAITIEVSSDNKHPFKVTDAAYRALIDLLVDICQRNPGIGTLKWKSDKSLIGKVNEQNMTVHRWFANKACPGDYLYNKHGEIAAEVNKRLGVVTEPVSTVESYTLTQFIKDVQKAIGAVVDGVAGPQTMSMAVTLSANKNDAHAAIKPVQKRLRELGYTEVGIPDSIAGHMFTNAVKLFQQDNGEVVDGVIGPQTWKKLFTVETYTLKKFIMDTQKAIGAVVDGVAGPQTMSMVVTISATQNNKHAAVKAIQKRLRALGYTEVGSADGLAGYMFTAAVKHFQKDNGEVVDGVVGPQTWKKLLETE